MLRFRNPSSNIENQILIFKILFETLGEDAEFGFIEMGQAITSGSQLMSAYGHSGQKAAAISSQKPSARDSIKMNAKMFAEIFRLYGWIAPAGESAYPVHFTFLGKCAASNLEGARRLIKESAIGLVNPNQNNQNTKAKERVRVFPFILKTMRDLGGYIYKHELCMGPMSTSDEEPEAYEKMIAKLEANRASFKKFDEEFSKFCDNLGMQRDSVDNSTRLPVSLLEQCGWIEKERTTEVFGTSRLCLRITQKGLEDLSSYEQMRDLRLSEIEKLTQAQVDAANRHGVYAMLRRSGFIFDYFQESEYQDKKVLEPILGNDTELLYSPYQTLHAERVNKSLGLNIDYIPIVPAAERLSIPSFTRETEPKNKIRIRYKTWPSNTKSSENDTDIATELRRTIRSMNLSGGTEDSIAKELFRMVGTQKQSEFYPLVAAAFEVLGFKCHASRAGDNGARWDAIIEDSQKSIPIEIKSPTEERHLSLKAIRQALENKIVLLSRRTHETTWDTTSLAVGYELPNERAEVADLITNVKDAYGITLGVIGLRSLLKMVVHAELSGETPDKKSIEGLFGILEKV